MKLLIPIVLALCAALPAAEILDRTAAVVGAETVLASEIELQLRLEAMFGDRPLDLSGEAREAALERLIDQRLLAQEIELAGFETPSQPESIAELRQAQFNGLPFAQALERYGVTAEQAEAFLDRQLRFTSYIEFRFGAGLEIDPENVDALYKERYPDRSKPLVDVREQLEESVRASRVEAQLNDHLKRLRIQTRILRLPVLTAADAEAPPEPPTEELP